MTYILEKYYELDSKGELHKAKWMYAIVRPCKHDYDFLLKAFTGKLDKETVIKYEGQVASYDDPFGSTSKAKTVEEWLIDLDLSKGIRPDFEEMYIQYEMTIDYYSVKTIDLHTNKVIYDNVDKLVELLMHKHQTLS